MTFEGKRVDLRRFERRPGELLARRGPARAPPDQPGARPPDHRQRDRDRPDRRRWEVVGVDPGRRPFLRRILGKNVGSARQVRSRSSTSPRSSPSSRTSRRRDCASRTASSPNCTPPRSPTSSSRPATKRGRRSSRPSGRPRARGRRLRRARHDPPARVPRGAQRRRRRAAARAHGARQRRRPHQRDRPGASAADPRATARRDQKSKVRQLLSYSADTAGGLMNPDFVSVPATATVDDALEAIRTSQVPGRGAARGLRHGRERPADRRGVDRAAGARAGDTNSR